MSTVVILCEVLKDEVTEICKKYNVKNPIIYMDSKLHVNTDRLRKELQRVINYVSYADKIILCFGRCGNALIGLCSETSDIIFPKTDDCISLITANNKIVEDMRCNTYFLSEGWIKSKSGIVSEYDRCLKRYGRDMCAAIFDNMLKNYTKLCYINTVVPQSRSAQTDKIAEALKLEPQNIDSDMSLLEKLLTGIPDPNIVSVKKGNAVTLHDFYERN